MLQNKVSGYQVCEGGGTLSASISITQCPPDSHPLWSQDSSMRSVFFQHISSSHSLINKSYNCKQQSTFFCFGLHMCLNISCIKSAVHSQHNEKEMERLDGEMEG